MAETFTVLIRVRYAECDPQKVVFNARYGDYVDLAVTEYYRALFGSYDWLLEQGIDNQVVSLKTDWQSSARFDDVLRITVEPLHFGNTSFSFRLAFYDDGTGREVAVSDITYVMVQADSHEKTAIPAFFREAFEKPCGKLVNLAGI